MATAKRSTPKKKASATQGRAKATAGRRTKAKTAPRTTAASRGQGRAKPRAKKAPSAARPKGAATVADLRRIARSIVTSTSVMDERRMLSLYADSAESQEVGGEPSYGIEAIRQKRDMWKKRVSDERWHARNLWVDGQTVIIEWEAALSMRPNGRKVVHRELAIHEVRNGKIVRERFYYDPAAF